MAIVNEGARKAEQMQKLLDLQARFSPKLSIFVPSRVLVKNSPIEHLTQSNERKKRELYLFNDMLLIAKPMDDKLRSMGMVPFESISVSDCPDQGSGKENLFEVTHGSVKYTLQADSAYSKSQWLKTLTETLNTWTTVGEGKSIQEDETEPEIPIIHLKRTASTGSAHKSIDSLRLLSTKMSGLSRSISGGNLKASLDNVSNNFLHAESTLNRSISKKKSPLGSKKSLAGSAGSLENSKAPKIPKKIDFLGKQPSPPKHPKPAAESASPRISRSQSREMPGTKSPAVENSSISRIANNPFIVQDRPIPSKPGNESNTCVNAQKIADCDRPATKQRPDAVNRSPSTLTQEIGRDIPKVISESLSASPERQAFAKALNAKLENAAGKTKADDNQPSFSETNHHRKYSSENKQNVKKPVLNATIATVGRTSETYKSYVSYRIPQLTLVVFQVYPIDLVYIGGDSAKIMKTYDEFLDFHMKLIGHFPAEAGLSINGNSEPRIIPGF